MNRNTALMMAGLALAELGCNSQEIKLVKGQLEQAKSDIQSAVVEVLDLDKAGKCTKLDPYIKYDNLKCPTDFMHLSAYTKDHSHFTFCDEQRLEDKQREVDKESGNKHRSKIECDIGLGAKRVVTFAWDDPSGGYAKESLQIIDTGANGGIDRSYSTHIENMRIGEPAERMRLYLSSATDRTVRCVPRGVPLDPRPIQSYLCNNVELLPEDVIEIRDDLRDALAPFKKMEFNQ